MFETVKFEAVDFNNSIAVVEDAPPLRLLQILAMADEGFTTVVEAGTATEAIELLHQRYEEYGSLALGAILLDKELVNEQGDAVAKEVRKLGGDEILIISTTFLKQPIEGENIHLDKTDPYLMAEQAKAAIADHTARTKTPS
jgi:CheY-like chemotaxis protein